MVKSADRTLDILTMLAGASAPLTHGDLARGLGIPKSSLTGLLRSLEAKGWIDQAQDTGRIALGPAVLTLAAAFLRGLDLVAVVRPELRALRDAVAETATLAVLRGDEIVVLAQEPGPQALAAVMRLGDRAPALRTASGRAIAAYLPEAERERLLGLHAAEPGASPAEAVRAGLDATRAGAVACSDQEWIPGLVALAAPVFGPERAPLGAIGVALPALRLDARRRALVETLVGRAAATASRRLGGAPLQGAAD